MACYNPIIAYKGQLKENGKREIIFRKANSEDSLLDSEVKLPCGKCIGCKLERAKEWTLRCIHESQLHERNCFITLTYNDENLPKDGSLNKDHFRLFMMKLRKLKSGIRFFHSGEYGSMLERPHYHALIFNFDFEDKVVMYEKNGFKIFTSKTLEDLWGKGFCTIGALTPETASYVARYCLKKMTDENSDKYYNGKQPEYSTMSRRPGIGRKWFEKFSSDVYPSDYCINNGYKLTPPKYYDKILENQNPNLFESIKGRRRFNCTKVKIEKEGDKIKIMDDNDSVRLRVKEKVKKARVLKFKRLEDYGNDVKNV